MNLQDLSAALLRFPDLAALKFHGLNRFLRMASLARPAIEFQQVDKRNPPAVLHPQILETIAASLGVTDINVVSICWSAFKDIIWDHRAVSPTEEEIKIYNDAALDRGTSFHHVYPPVRVCQISGCRN
ncbi:hypothetical protein C8J57DRAFT_1019287, partial [Mycena rebaudengoi]